MSHGSAISFTRCSGRILLHGLEEGAVAVRSRVAAAEHGCQVETEAVDVHLLHPVAQAVHHHLQHARVADVEVLPQPLQFS